MSVRTSVCLSLLSTLGVLLGLSGCIAFFIYGNIAASVWSFLSVLFASINLQLHLIYIRGTLDEWHSVDTLEGLKLFGFFTFSISSGFFLWYIFYIAYMGAPIIPVKDSMAVTAVWIFMTANWCGCLYLCSKRYINILNDASRPLLSHI